MAVSHFIKIIILLIIFNVVVIKNWDGPSTQKGWDGPSTQNLVWVLRMMMPYIQQCLKRFGMQIMRLSGESRKGS